jgi:hypothetical protein
MNNRIAVLTAAGLLVTLPACAAQITPSHADLIAPHAQQVVVASPTQLQSQNPGATLTETHTVARALVMFDRSAADTSCNLSPIQEHQLQDQDAEAYGAFWVNAGEHVYELKYPPSSGATWMRQILTDDGYTGYTCKDYLADSD